MKIPSAPPRFLLRDGGRESYLIKQGSKGCRMGGPFLVCGGMIKEPHGILGTPDVRLR